MSEKTFVRHESCPKCGSSDAVGVWLTADGQEQAHCFSCNYHKAARSSDSTDDDTPVSAPAVSGPFVTGDYRDLTKRGLTKDTCETLRYHIGDYRGQKVQVADYCDIDGNLIAQKIRFPDKTFSIVGNAKEMGIRNKHLWKGFPRTGRFVLTEGEVDDMTIFQCCPNTAAGSVPNGAQAAKKAVIKDLAWLSEWAEVIIAFDMDEPGRAAAQECAQLLPPGKVKILELPMKDANDMLKAGKVAELFKAVVNAKPYKPQGVVTLKDILADVLKKPTIGLPWWDARLTELTYGRRTGEIYMFGAGTGVGKTDWFSQQVAYDLTVLKQKVALFFLEQQPVETAKRLSGKVAGKRFHVPDGSWSDEELVTSVSALSASNLLHLYDHFGEASWEAIESTIRFLHHSEGIKLFYVDHLTALAAAEKDEREGLERIMAKMGRLVKELDIVIHCISHLSTPEGKPHEEGGRVMIRHFKGSRAIGFWSHYMFGLERDQQADDPAVRTTTTFRVLKDRYTGQATGQCFDYGYDAVRGQLVPQSDTHSSNPFSSVTAPEGNTDF